MQISDAKNNFNNINCVVATLTAVAFHKIYSFVHIVSDAAAAAITLLFFVMKNLPSCSRFCHCYNCHCSVAAIATFSNKSRKI